MIHAVEASLATTTTAPDTATAGHTHTHTHLHLSCLASRLVCGAAERAWSSFLLRAVGTARPQLDGRLSMSLSHTPSSVASDLSLASQSSEREVPPQSRTHPRYRTMIVAVLGDLASESRTGVRKVAAYALPATQAWFSDRCLRFHSCSLYFPCFCRGVLLARFGPSGAWGSGRVTRMPFGPIASSGLVRVQMRKKGLESPCSRYCRFFLLPNWSTSVPLSVQSKLASVRSKQVTEEPLKDSADAFAKQDRTTRFRRHGREAHAPRKDLGPW